MQTRIQELREQRNATIEGMRAMLDAKDEALDEEEYDAMQAQVDDLNARIQREEKLAAQEAELDKPEPSVGEIQATGQGQVPEGLRPIRGPEAKTEFENFGEFLFSTVFRQNDQRLDYQDFGELRGEQRMDTGSAGGFAVPKQFRPEILKVDPAETPLLSRVREWPAGSPPDAEVEVPALDQDTASSPDHQFGGVVMKWLGEGAPQSATEAKHRQVTIKPEELGGFIPATEKLLRNWMGSSGHFMGLLRAARAAFVEDALHSGNGVKKPLGIFQSDAAIAVNRASANTVTYGDLAKMVAKLLKRGGSPIWLCNPALLEDLLKLENTNGNLIWVRDNAAEGSPGRLLGYPLFEDEFATAKGTKGDLALVTPDPYYIMKRGSGPFVVAGRSGTDFESNKMKIKIVDNVGGQPWLKEPFKRRDGSETSPFIQLDVPAS